MVRVRITDFDYCIKKAQSKHIQGKTATSIDGKNRHVLSGELNDHLGEIDRTASEMVYRLTVEMAKSESITEALKASNQMAWVAAMNNIRNRAEEIVLREVVYA